MKEPLETTFESRSHPRGHPRDADFLRSLNRALGAPNDPQEIIGLACKLTGEYLGASRCYFAEIRGSSVDVQDDWHAREKPGIAGTYAMSDFLPDDLWDEMARSGLAIRDVFDHELTRDRTASFAAISVQSFAAALCGLGFSLTATAQPVDLMLRLKERVPMETLAKSVSFRSEAFRPTS